MLHIDRFSQQPIYEQVIAQIETLIAGGLLKPGEQLPSVRNLSQEISVNPNTLQKAYAELDRRSLTITAPGNGRFIAKDAREKLMSGQLRELEAIEALARKLASLGVALDRVLSAVHAGYAGAGAELEEDKV